ncbi:MAG: hypothetical protein QW815_00350 [Nitrososphaerota archaeon]
MSFTTYKTLVDYVSIYLGYGTEITPLYELRPSDTITVDLKGEVTPSLTAQINVSEGMNVSLSEVSAPTHSVGLTTFMTTYTSVGITPFHAVTLSDTSDLTLSEGI